LEIGAGGGNMLVHIKEKGLAAEVMGVELIQIEGSNQQNRLIDKFQLANIENEEINAQKEYFDVIICADVLEHLSDPWAIVKKISGHLKKGGILIASIPNIREWKTLLKIFRGDFGYDPEGGIMDKTHLRFFCRKNMEQLLTTDELTPIWWKPNFLLKELPAGKKRRIINRLTFGLLTDFLTVQYLFIAKKKE
jgi:2-polyprenyl-3-methyl-5-hydroxy-6-metoxy-1,4-benzoquinol methylase